MPATELTRRGTSVCRGCAGQDLRSVLDLGSQPLANGLVDSPATRDPEFPLHLRICTACGLGQLGEFVLPEHIFSEYPYLSSTSTSWLAHAQAYTNSMHAQLELADGELVLEVASNDGYLLRAFASLGQSVLGVEPAKNVAAIAAQSGVPTICAFFGRRLASEVAERHGRPRLIVANNVMAHVPDLDDFIAGLVTLGDERTIVTVENPSLMNLLLGTQFDTIYHEHFSYLTVHAVRTMVRRHGLELVRVEALATHGGSNRYWLAKPGSTPTDDTVTEALDVERDSGLLDPDVWGTFAADSWDAVRGLRAWLDERRAAQDLVVAVGAAAKGNTLMNAAQVTSKDIAAVTDASLEKQGKYLPGSHLPIIPHDGLTDLKPDDVLITPWNLATELTPIILERVPAARVWVAVPRMRRVA